MYDKQEKMITWFKEYGHRFKYVCIFSVLWCLFVALLYHNSSSINKEHMEEQLLTQAQNLYTFVLDTRNWNAKHGGVYVRESDFGVPNKWLPEDSRSVSMPDGTRFVLINPAYMSRQLSEDSNLPGAHFKITSVNPLRPENKADEWETRAFEINAKGQPEVYSYEKNSKDKIFFRYLKPLYAIESCLICHKNYTVGSVLGGISINLNAQDVIHIVQEQNATLFLAYGFMALAGSFGIAGFSLLRHRKEQLKIAKEKMKESFVANMSHDMRTPLSGILGMTQLLSQDMPEAQRKEILKYLHIASTSLLEMVSDITDYAALDADKMHLNLHSFDLRKELEQCCALFLPSCLSKSLGLVLEVKKGVPKYIIGDAFRIRQVLGNVVNNAVKFTETGTITIDVWFKNDVLFLKVTDSGCGIAVEDQAHIFTRFERGRAVTKSDKPGTGLGLAIVQEVVSRMQGKVTVYSIEGEGTSFTISLPVGVGECVEDTVQAVKLNNTKMCSQVHVLLVEDNTVTAYFVHTVLEKMGCIVHMAASGEDALELLTQFDIDIIMLDMRMSGMDGLSTAEHVRGISKYQSTPIVLMSASVIEAEENRLKELCIAKTLLKPVPAKEIMNLISEYVPQKFNQQSPYDDLAIFEYDKALEALDGDKELLNKLIQVWISDFKTQHDKLCLAFEQYQAELLINLAHAIKNSAGTLYFTLLQHEAAQIEAKLKTGEAVDCSNLIKAHQSTYTELLKNNSVAG